MNKGKVILAVNSNWSPDAGLVEMLNAVKANPEVYLKAELERVPDELNKKQIGFFIACLLSLRMWDEKRASDKAAAVAALAQKDERLTQSVLELKPSVRAENCMAAAGIETIGDLVAKSEREMLWIKNFGRTSLKELKRKLGELGLAFKPE